MKRQKQLTIMTYLILFISIAHFALAANSTIGSWDSNIYNLIEHPRTIAIRIEVYDSATRIPISNAQVRFFGNFMTEHRTSRDPGGEQRSQKQEVELFALTDNNGIAIASFQWRKEYPWRDGIDGIEKVQKLEVTRRGYRFIEQPLPFTGLLNVGQQMNSATQLQAVFDRFESNWSKECSKENVVFCTMRFDKSFPDFDNPRITNSEFFQKIKNKDWGIVYTKPVNRHQKMDGDQRLCGPYLIYTYKIYMDKIQKDRPDPLANIRPDQIVDITSRNTISEQSSEPVKKKPFFGEPKWQQGFLASMTWGMDAKEVEKLLASKGARLTITSNYKMSGRIHHQATVSGQHLYGSLRVDSVEMGFADGKLSSVTFTPVDSSEVMIDRFYDYFQKQYGTGLISSWPASDKVKQMVPSAKPNYESKWFFPITGIECKKDYGWSSRAKRYERFTYVKFYNWNIAADRNPRLKSQAQIFQEQRTKSVENNETSCRDCGGSGRCVHCNGKGFTMEYTYITCTDRRCKGAGKYRVYGPGGGIVTCQRCQGTGKIKISNSPEKVTCKKCSGTGKCVSCKGEGHIKRN